MEQNDFLTQLQIEIPAFTSAIATDKGDWVVKGFVDVFRNVYTISVDTKVISKVLELLLFPSFVTFANKYEYELVLAPEQNFYPDLTFVSRVTGEKFAVDIKSTYRTTASRVNGMTLGAFTGYFRNRTSRKNVVFPYEEYQQHIVVGIVYSQIENAQDERQIYQIGDLENIISVVKDFVVFAQPKYRIASTRPGSGNTKNIGSVTVLEQLLNGTGPFSQLGEIVYDDYWMYYLTMDMARAADLSKRPYYDLTSYLEYKNLKETPAAKQAEKLEAQDVDKSGV
jgi:hypothetical protein